MLQVDDNALQRGEKISEIPNSASMLLEDFAAFGFESCHCCSCAFFSIGIVSSNEHWSPTRVNPGTYFVYVIRRPIGRPISNFDFGYHKHADDT